MPMNQEQFQQALINNNLDLLQSLISEIDPSELSDVLGPALLREALELGEKVSDETLFLLLQYPLIHQAITRFSEDGRHALHYAAQTNHWRALVLFFAYISNPNEINTPTQMAYKLKISNTEGVTSFTPLMLAAIHRRIEAIHALFALYDQNLDITRLKDSKKHHASHYLTSDKYSHLSIDSLTSSESHQSISKRCQELREKHRRWMEEGSEHESNRTEISSSLITPVGGSDSQALELHELSGTRTPLDTHQPDKIDTSSEVLLPKFKEAIHQAMNDFLKQIDEAHPGYLPLCTTFVDQQKTKIDNQKNDLSTIEANSFIQDIKDDAQRQFKMHHQVLRIFLDCLMIATIPLGLGIAFAGIKRLTTGYSFFYLNHPDLGQKFSDSILSSPNFSSTQ